MRNIYEIQDGGELFWYSVDSESQARQVHNKLVVEPLGEAGNVEAIKQLPDDTLLKIGDAGPGGEPVEKTARMWADHEEGLIGATVY
jgi:hypothetical protein